MEKFYKVKTKKSSLIDVIYYEILMLNNIPIVGTINLLEIKIT